MNLMSLEKCIKEYGKDIYSFFVYLTRNRHDADELYQQTFSIFKMIIRSGLQIRWRL